MSVDEMGSVQSREPNNESQILQNNYVIIHAQIRQVTSVIIFMARSGRKKCCRCRPTCGKILSHRQHKRHYAAATKQGVTTLMQCSGTISESSNANTNLTQSNAPEDNMEEVSDNIAKYEGLYLSLSSKEWVNLRQN